MLCSGHDDRGASLTIPDYSPTPSAPGSPSFAPFDLVALEGIISRLLSVHLDKLRDGLMLLVGSDSGRVAVDEVAALREENKSLKIENESLKEQLDRLALSASSGVADDGGQLGAVGGLDADAPVFVAAGGGASGSVEDSMISYASALESASGGRLSVRPLTHSGGNMGDNRDAGRASGVMSQMRAPGLNSQAPLTSPNLDRTRRNARRRPRVRGSGSDFSISGTARRRWFHLNNLAPGTAVETVAEHVRNVVGISDVACESLTSNTKYCSFKICVPECDTPRLLNGEVWPREVTIRDFYYRRPADGNRSATGGRENFLEGRPLRETGTG